MVVVLFCFRLVPVAVGRRLGSALGHLGLRVRPRERRRARENLTLAFPELDPRGREELLKSIAGALGRNFFDNLSCARLAGADEGFQDYPGDTASFGDFGAQLANLASPGRGVILLTGHIGSWELLGARVARLLERRGCGPLAVVTGTIHNPPVDAMLNRRRRRLGLRPLARREGLRPIFEHLRQGGIAALLLDQKLSQQDPAARFFGEPAPTPDGMARMALKLQVPILPVAMAWDETSGRHTIQRLPVLNASSPRADDQVDEARQLARLQQEAQDALEEFVRRNPEQWVWFHERWATKG